MRQIDLSKLVPAESPTHQPAVDTENATTREPNAFDRATDVTPKYNPSNNAIDLSKMVPVKTSHQLDLGDAKVEEDTGLLEAAWNNFKVSKNQMEVDMWRGMRTNEELKNEDTGFIQDAMRSMFSTEFIENRIKENSLDLEEAMQKVIQYNKQFNGKPFRFNDMWNAPKKFLAYDMPQIMGGMAGLMVEPMMIGVGAGIVSQGTLAVPAWGASMIAGATALLASRPFESLAEAQQAADQVYETVLAKTGNEKAAKQAAIKGWESVFNDNMQMAWADAAEVIIATAPFGKLLTGTSKMARLAQSGHDMAYNIRKAMAYNSASRAISPILKTAVVQAKEAWEEGQQQIWQNRGFNMATETMSKADTWADALNPNDPGYEEMVSQMQGGFLGGTFMAGGGMAFNRAKNALFKVNSDIRFGDVKDVKNQQKPAWHQLVMRAAENDNAPEMEAMIQELGRAGFYSTTPSQDKQAKIKESQKQAGEIIKEFREIVREYENVKNTFPNIKKFDNRKMYVGNLLKIREVSAHKSEDDTVNKQNELFIKAVKMVNERLAEGQDLSGRFGRVFLSDKAIKTLYNGQIAYDGIKAGRTNEDIKADQITMTAEEKAAAKAELGGGAKSLNLTNLGSKKATKGWDGKQDYAEFVAQQQTAFATRNEDLNNEIKAGIEYIENGLDSYGDDAKQLTTKEALDADAATTADDQKNTAAKKALKGLTAGNAFDNELAVDDTNADKKNAYTTILSTLKKQNAITAEEHDKAMAGSQKEARQVIANGYSRLHSRAIKAGNTDMAKTITTQIENARLLTGERLKERKAINEELGQTIWNPMVTQLQKTEKGPGTKADKAKAIKKQAEQLRKAAENDKKKAPEYEAAAAYLDKKAEEIGPKAQQRPAKQPKTQTAKPPSNATKPKRGAKKNNKPPDPAAPAAPAAAAPASNTPGAQPANPPAAEPAPAAPASTPPADPNNSATPLADNLLKHQAAAKKTRNNRTAKAIGLTIGATATAAQIYAMSTSQDSGWMQSSMAAIQAAAVFVGTSVKLAAEQIEEVIGMVYDKLIEMFDGKPRAEISKAIRKEIKDSLQAVYLLENKKKPNAMKLYEAQVELEKNRAVDRIFTRLAKELEQINSYYSRLQREGKDPAQDADFKKALNEVLVQVSQRLETDFFDNIISGFLDNVSEKDRSVLFSAEARMKNINKTVLSRLFAERQEMIIDENGEQHLVGREPVYRMNDGNVILHRATIKQLLMNAFHGITEFPDNFDQIIEEKVKPVSMRLADEIRKYSENDKRSLFTLMSSTRVPNVYALQLTSTGALRLDKQNKIRRSSNALINSFRSEAYQKANDPQLWKDFEAEYMAIWDLNAKQDIPEGKFFEGAVPLSKLRDLVRTFNSEVDKPSLSKEAREAADSYIDYVTQHYFAKYFPGSPEVWRSYMIYFSGKEGVPGNIDRLRRQIIADPNQNKVLEWYMFNMASIDKEGSVKPVQPIALPATEKKTNAVKLNKKVSIDENSGNAYKKFMMALFELPGMKDMVPGETRDIPAEVLQSITFEEGLEGKSHTLFSIQPDKATSQLRATSGKNTLIINLTAKIAIDPKTQSYSIYVPKNKDQGPILSIIDKKTKEVLAESRQYPSIQNDNKMTLVDKARSVVMNGAVVSIKGKDPEHISYFDKLAINYEKAALGLNSSTSYLGEDGNQKSAEILASALDSAPNGLDEISMDRNVDGSFIDRRMAAVAVVDGQANEIPNQWVLWAQQQEEPVTVEYTGEFKDQYRGEYGNYSEQGTQFQIWYELALFANGTANNPEAYFHMIGQQADDPRVPFIAAQKWTKDSARSFFQTEEGKMVLRELGFKNLEGLTKQIKDDRDWMVKKLNEGKISSETVRNVASDENIENYLYSQAINQFYVNNFFKPKYRMENGKAVTQYKDIRNYVKRKISGNGLRIALKEKPTLKVAALDELNIEGEYDMNDPLQARIANKEKTNGVIFISEEMGELISKSLPKGTLPGGNFKLLVDHRNTATNARVYGKANFVVLSKELVDSLAKVNPNAPAVAYYELMQKNGLDMLGFKGSFKIFDQPYVKVGYKKEGDKLSLNDEGKASLNSEIPSTTIESKNMFWQQNLQFSANVMNRTAPVQMFNHMMKADKTGTIGRIIQQIYAIQEQVFEVEWNSLGSEQEKREWLIRHMPEVYKGEEIEAFLSTPGLSLNNPSTANLFDSIRSNLIKNEVMKIFIEGNALIEMPNISGEPLNGVYSKRSKDGKVEPVEALIPESMKDKVKIGDTFIIARVPTSDTHSFHVVKAVGYLPKSSGAMIMTADTLQVISGSDNDGDARYTWIRSQQPSEFDGDPAKIAELLNEIEKVSKDLVKFSGNERTRVFDRVDEPLGKMQKAIKNNNISAAMAKAVNDIFDFRRVKPYYDQIEDALEAAMVTAYMNEGLSNMTEAYDMIPELANAIVEQLRKPFEKVDSEYVALKDELNSLQNDVQLHLKALSNKIFDKITDYYADPANLEDITNKIDLTKTDKYIADRDLGETTSEYDWYSKRKQFEIFADTNNGEKGIGIGARIVAGRNTESTIKTRLQSSIPVPSISLSTKAVSAAETARTGKKKKYVVKAGKAQTPIATFWHGEEKDKEIGHALANDLNQFLDALNAGNLEKLGYNEFTFPLITTMKMLGMPNDVVLDIMKSPVVMDLVERYMKKRNPLLTQSYSSIYEDAVKAYRGQKTKLTVPGKSTAVQSHMLNLLDIDDPASEITGEKLNRIFADSFSNDDRPAFQDAKAYVVRWLFAIQKIADEKHAFAMLSNIQNDMPVTIEEINTIKTYMDQLGINPTSKKLDKGYEANHRNYMTYTIDGQTGFHTFNEWWHRHNQATNIALVNRLKAFNEMQMMGNIWGIDYLTSLKNTIKRSRQVKSWVNKDKAYETKLNGRDVVRYKEIFDDLFAASALGITETSDQLLEQIMKSETLMSLIETSSSVENPDAVLVFDGERIRLSEKKMGMTAAETDAVRQMLAEKLTMGDRELLTKYQVLMYGVNQTNSYQAGFIHIFPSDMLQVMDTKIKNLETVLNNMYAGNQAEKVAVNDFVNSMAEAALMRSPKSLSQVENVTPQNAKLVNTRFRKDEIVEVVSAADLEVGTMVMSKETQEIIDDDGKPKKVERTKIYTVVVDPDTQAKTFNVDSPLDYNAAKLSPNQSIITPSANAKVYARLQKDPTDAEIATSQKVKSTQNKLAIDYLLPENADTENFDKELDEYIENILVKKLKGAKIFTKAEDVKRYFDLVFGPGQDFNMEAAGATIGDVYYINTEKPVQEARLHEAAHMYVNMLPKDHYVLKRLDELTGNREATVNAIGKAATHIVEMMKRGENPSTFVTLMKQFWISVKNLFKAANQEELVWLTAQRIINTDTIEANPFGGPEQDAPTVEYLTKDITLRKRAQQNIQKIKDVSNAITSNFDESSHTYHDPTSPSTVLSSVTEQIPKEFRQFAYTGPEDAGKVAAEQGERMHKIPELLLQGKNADDIYAESGLGEAIPGSATIPHMTREVFDQILPVIKETMDKVIEGLDVTNLSEVAIMHTNAKMAGRVDWLIVNNATNTGIIVDFKFSNNFDKWSDKRNGQPNSSKIDQTSVQTNTYAEILEGPDYGLHIEKQILLPFELKFAADKQVITGMTPRKPENLNVNTNNRTMARDMLNDMAKRVLASTTAYDEQKEALSFDQYLRVTLQESAYQALENDLARAKKDLDHFESIGDADNVRILNEVITKLEINIKTIQDGHKKYIQQHREASAELRVHLAEIDSYIDRATEINKQETKTDADLNELADLRLKAQEAIVAAMGRLDQIIHEGGKGYHRQVLSQMYEKLYAKLGAMQDGGLATGADLTRLNVYMKPPSNIPKDQLPSLAFALQHTQAALRQSAIETEQYERESQRLTRDLFKESKIFTRLKEKYGYVKAIWMYMTDPDTDADLMFENFFQEDPANPGKFIIKSASQLNTPAEKAWMEFHEKWLHRVHEQAGINDTPSGYFPKVSMQIYEAMRSDVSQRFMNVTDSMADLGAKDVRLFSAQILNADGSIREVHDITLQKLIYEQNSQVMTQLTEEQVQKAIDMITPYIKKANKLNAMGVNEKTPSEQTASAINRTLRSAQYFMVNGQMVADTEKPGFLGLDSVGKLESTFDTENKSDHFSRNLYRAFNREITQRIHVNHIRKSLPFLMAAQAHYQAKGLDKMNTSKWIEEYIRKDVLLQRGKMFLSDKQEEYTNFLRKWTYLKALTFNIPVATVNMIGGVISSLIFQGTRKTLTRGMKRLLSNPKKFFSIVSHYKLSDFQPEEYLAITQFTALKNIALAGMIYSEKFIQGLAFINQMTDDQYDMIGNDGLSSAGLAKQREFMTTYANERSPDMSDEDFWNYLLNELNPAGINKYFLNDVDIAAMKAKKDRMLGNYSRNDQGNYHRYVWMSTLMMFKTWLPAVWKAHWGQFQHDIYDTPVKGLVPSVYDQVLWLPVIRDMRLAAIKLFDKDVIASDLADKRSQEEKDLDKENTWKAIKEALVLSFLIFLMAPDDDDDKEAKERKQKAYYLFQQVGYVFDFNSWQNTVKNAVPALTTLMGFLDAFEKTITLDTYEKKTPGGWITGDNRKGDYKADDAIINQIPIVSNINRDFGFQKFE